VNNIQRCSSHCRQELRSSHQQLLSQCIIQSETAGQPATCLVHQSQQVHVNNPYSSCSQIAVNCNSTDQMATLLHFVNGCSHIDTKYNARCWVV